ncbi:MAG: hypothetical protein JNK74_28710, partial [Candidatus Hydrogenedentes bacterium]|nr:hypothetical protein [Candidatus Hydrogenedentota bacterium]
ASWLDSGKPDAEVLDEMFLSTLSRYPSPQEKDRLLTRVARASARRETWEDLLWAILNSKEFVFNH